MHQIVANGELQREFKFGHGWVPMWRCKYRRQKTFIMKTFFWSIQGFIFISIVTIIKKIKLVKGSL